jgi:Nitrate reductase delta subunit
VSSGRWELLRALGAVAGDPADALRVLAALDIPGCDEAAHTSVFVLNCPPYASVYLGAEGGLGGSAADRVAGFWRAIGLSPPAEPDHLTVLLSLYAQLGERWEEACLAADSAATAALGHARQALFAEHLWAWLPGYLAAVADLGTPALSTWASVLEQAIAAEHASAAIIPLALPLALRDAPPPVDAGCGLGELLDALTTPVRSGMLLTRQALAAGAGRAGAGHRIGERRFALRAMLEQEPDGTCTWLAEEASRWAERHLAAGPEDPVQQWWALRASVTAQVLGTSRRLHAAAGESGVTRGEVDDGDAHGDDRRA